MLRGGTTSSVSPANGKKELKRTAGALSTLRRGFEPFFSQPQLRHRRTDRRKNRVAVIDQVHAIARAGIRTEAPGTHRDEIERQSSSWKNWPATCLLGEFFREIGRSDQRLHAGHVGAGQQFLFGRAGRVETRGRAR